MKIVTRAKPRQKSTALTARVMRAPETRAQPAIDGGRFASPPFHQNGADYRNSVDAVQATAFPWSGRTHRSVAVFGRCVGFGIGAILQCSRSARQSCCEMMLLRAGPFVVSATMRPAALETKRARNGRSGDSVEASGCVFIVWSGRSCARHGDLCDRAAVFDGGVFGVGQRAVPSVDPLGGADARSGLPRLSARRLRRQRPALPRAVPVARRR